MLCSSCANQMISTKTVLKTGATQHELRCPRCGDQCVRSELVFDGEPFDLDPFANFQASDCWHQNMGLQAHRRENPTTSQQTAER